MLRVLPAAFVQPDVLVGAFAEGRRAALHRPLGLGLGPVADRVDTSGDISDPPLVADARLIEADFGIRPDASLALAAIEREAKGPVGPTLAARGEEQALAIGVALRRLCHEGVEALRFQPSHFVSASV